MSFLTVLLVLALAPACSDAAQRLPCSKKGSITLAATEHARAFSKFFADDSQIISGCLYGLNRRFALESTRGIEDVDVGARDIHIAGPFAAYRKLTSIKGSIPDEGLAVYDFRSGARKWSFPLTAAGGQAADLEVSPTGSIAWIENRSSGERLVRKAEGRGCTGECLPDAALTLDSNPEIDPASLAFSGTTLYWTSGGGARSATLEGSAPRSSADMKTGQSDPRCSLKGSETLAASATSRVYRSKPKSGAISYYGCRYRSDRPRLLGKEDDPIFQSFFPFALAGDSVAFGFDAGSSTFRDAHVFVFSLRSRMRRRLAYQTPAVHYSYLTDLALKPSGSIAWISYEAGDVWLGDMPTWTVYKADSQGQRRLDSGPDVDPESLALAGAILYWTKGGQPYSAPLN